MRGWAINPLMGPANHTNDVSCSDNPKLNKKGVPYLSEAVSTLQYVTHRQPKRHKRRNRNSRARTRVQRSKRFVHPPSRYSGISNPSSTTSSFEADS